METRVWSAVDLAIPWPSLAIRPDQDDLETQADPGRWDHTSRDPAIWATGPGLETRSGRSSIWQSRDGRWRSGWTEMTWRPRPIWDR